MKQLILFFWLLSSLSGFCQNTIRVTNGQNLQTVIDGAADNSVIIVEGGNYADITLIKPLKLYGTGYYLNGATSNSGLQATPAVSTIGNVTFSNTSIGSAISGFLAGNIITNATQISVSKCRFGSLTINNSNFQVKQSYFGGFAIAQNLMGVLINNNLIEGNGSIGNGTNVTLMNNSFVGGSQLIDIQGNIGNFKNNIFYPSFETGYGSNYWWTSYFNIISNTNNIIEYNILGNSYHTNISSGCGCIAPITNLNSTNKVGQNYANMYLTPLPDMTLDARYQLAPNSPAKGAGEGGTDAGAFGGDEPYVLSGIPSIPSIYQLTVPSQVQQGGSLNVQIKAKVNN